jgi:predicted nucleic acid-binding protein
MSILDTMKIYLDMCSLHRPLDNKTQIRIALEAEAVLGVIALCDAGQVELVSSEALLYEVSRNPNLTRKEYASEVLSKASSFVALNERIENRARELNRLGIKPLDGLHLASAEEAKADYLCTTDDKFLKRANRIRGIATKVVSPMELIKEIGK